MYTYPTKTQTHAHTYIYTCTQQKQKQKQQHNTQAAHQEALDTALKHERELQQLPALKRQLDALKAHATETELELRCVHVVNEHMYSWCEK